MNPQLAALIATLSVVQLRQLADTKEKAEQQMTSILGGQSASATTAPTSGSGAAGQVPTGVATAQPTKRTMSPAAKRAISLKAKARWATINRGKRKGAKGKTARKGNVTANGRIMTPAARKRIAEAQKKRWAAVNAAKAQQAATPAPAPATVAA